MRARTRNCLQCENPHCATVHIVDGLSPEAVEVLADFLTAEMGQWEGSSTIQRELINFRNGLASQLTHWPIDNSDLLG